MAPTSGTLFDFGVKCISKEQYDIETERRRAADLAKAAVEKAEREAREAAAKATARGPGRPPLKRKPAETEPATDVPQEPGPKPKRVICILDPDAFDINGQKVGLTCEVDRLYEVKLRRWQRQCKEWEEYQEKLAEGINVRGSYTEWFTAELFPPIHAAVQAKGSIGKAVTALNSHSSKKWAKLNESTVRGWYRKDLPKGVFKLNDKAQQALDDALELQEDAAKTLPRGEGRDAILDDHPDILELIVELLKAIRAAGVLGCTLFNVLPSFVVVKFFTQSGAVTQSGAKSFGFAGGVINSAVAYATIRGIVEAKLPDLLESNGGPFKVNRRQAWPLN